MKQRNPAARLDDPDDRDDRDDDDDAPTTPTDEPKPVPVQDPPAEPDQAPYVVGGQHSRAVLERVAP